MLLKVIEDFNKDSWMPLSRLLDLACFCSTRGNREGIANECSVFQKLARKMHRKGVLSFDVCSIHYDLSSKCDPCPLQQKIHVEMSSTATFLRKVGICNTKELWFCLGKRPKLEPRDFFATLVEERVLLGESVSTSSSISCKALAVCKPGHMTQKNVFLDFAFASQKTELKALQVYNLIFAKSQFIESDIELAGLIEIFLKTPGKRNSLAPNQFKDVVKEMMDAGFAEKICNMFANDARGLIDTFRGQLQSKELFPLLKDEMLLEYAEASSRRQRNTGGATFKMREVESRKRVSKLDGRDTNFMMEVKSLCPQVGEEKLAELGIVFCSWILGKFSHLDISKVREQALGMMPGATSWRNAAPKSFGTTIAIIFDRLKTLNTVFLCFDHGDQDFPIIACGWSSEEKKCVRILIDNQRCGKASDDIANHLKQRAEQWNFEKKFKGAMSDAANFAAHRDAFNGKFDGYFQTLSCVLHALSLEIELPYTNVFGTANISEPSVLMMLRSMFWLHKTDGERLKSLVTVVEEEFPELAFMPQGESFLELKSIPETILTRWGLLFSALEWVQKNGKTWIEAAKLSFDCAISTSESPGIRKKYLEVATWFEDPLIKTQMNLLIEYGKQVWEGRYHLCLNHKDESKLAGFSSNLMLRSCAEFSLDLQDFRQPGNDLDDTIQRSRLQRESTIQRHPGRSYPSACSSSLVDIDTYEPLNTLPDGSTPPWVCSDKQLIQNQFAKFKQIVKEVHEKHSKCWYSHFFFGIGDKKIGKYIAKMIYYKYKGRSLIGVLNSIDKHEVVRGLHSAKEFNLERLMQFLAAKLDALHLEVVKRWPCFESKRMESCLRQFGETGRMSSMLQNLINEYIIGFPTHNQDTERRVGVGRHLRHGKLHENTETFQARDLFRATHTQRDRFETAHSEGQKRYRPTKRTMQKNLEAMDMRTNKRNKVTPLYLDLSDGLGANAIKTKSKKRASFGSAVRSEDKRNPFTGAKLKRKSYEDVAVRVEVAEPPSLYGLKKITSLSTVEETRNELIEQMRACGETVDPNVLPEKRTGLRALLKRFVMTKGKYPGYLYPLGNNPR